MFGLIYSSIEFGHHTQFIKEKNPNLANKYVLLKKKKILRKDPFNMWYMYMKVILIKNLVGFDPNKIPNLEGIIGSVPP